MLSLRRPQNRTLFRTRRGAATASHFSSPDDSSIGYRFFGRRRQPADVAVSSKVLRKAVAPSAGVAGGGVVGHKPQMMQSEWFASRMRGVGECAYNVATGFDPFLSFNPLEMKTKQVGFLSLALAGLSNAKSLVSRDVSFNWTSVRCRWLLCVRGRY